VAGKLGLLYHQLTKKFSGPGGGCRMVFRSREQNKNKENAAEKLRGIFASKKANAEKGKDAPRNKNKIEFREQRQILQFVH
jgi:hypothetical protein